MVVDLIFPANLLVFRGESQYISEFDETLPFLIPLSHRSQIPRIQGLIVS